MLPYCPKGFVVPMRIAFLTVPHNLIDVRTVLGCVAGFGRERGILIAPDRKSVV